MNRTPLRPIAAGAVGLALILAAACGPDERVPGPVQDPAPLPGPPPEEPEIPEPDRSRQESLTLSPNAGTSDTAITLSGAGFPANTTLELGFGPPQSEYQVFRSVTTDAAGRFTTTVTPPDWAEPGRDYVFVAAGPGDYEVISEAFFLQPPER